LKRLVENGPYELCGANFIVRSDGTKIDLSRDQSGHSQHLQPGYIVERHLQDDDLVIFNRQPSLHKMSMMGHRVKILPYSSFRLNLSVTTPYNADFDGDEMNLHVPQSLESKAEVQQLMMVPLQMVTPRGNAPVMGIVQDTLLGCLMMSRQDAFIDKELMMNLLMQLDNKSARLPYPAIVRPRPLWTGKQLFSLIFPDLTYEDAFPWGQKVPSEMSGDDCLVVLKGEMLCGTLNKARIGPLGRIHHIAFLEKGPDACKSLLSQTQRVVNAWLLQVGHTVGLGDSIAEEGTYKSIQDAIDKAEKDVNDVIHQAQDNKLQQQPGKSMMESLEFLINSKLNNAVAVIGKSVKESLKDTNYLRRMVVSGSKGGDLNIAQMVGCVGQQNVEGKRIPFGFYNRTLPHFTKDDFSPASRGFVQNSYLRGLTPQEFFFHTMGGREGLIDTAVKTSETGYVQRKLIKSMEDLQVKYDGTVRTPSGTVVQFLYGEDGMDATRVERQLLPSLLQGNEDFKKMFQLVDPDTGLLDPKLDVVLSDDIKIELRQSDDAQQLVREEYQQLLRDRELLQFHIFPRGQDVYLPVNMQRLVQTAMKKFEIDIRSKSTLRVEEVVSGTRDLFRELVVVAGDDSLSLEIQDNAIQLFAILVRMTLASKRVLVEYRLTPAAFNWLRGEIKSKFFASFAHPGEVVGPIAGQSVGELVTQMTLNTFHHAGVSAKNVTLGVPRLMELLNLSPNTKNPSMSVYPSQELSNSEESKPLRFALQLLKLRKLTSTVEIYYDPDDNAILEDEQFLADDREIDFVESDRPEKSPWLLRIVLDQNVLHSEDLDAQQILPKIRFLFYFYFITILFIG